MRTVFFAWPGEGITGGNYPTVLEHAFVPICAISFSTINLPETFSNVANKFVRRFHVGRSNFAPHLLDS